MAEVKQNQSFTFGTIQDLETFVEGIKSSKKAQPAQKVKTPADQPKEESEFIEKTKETINKRIGQKMDVLKSAPLFKKPSFFLDTLTPIINIDMIVLMNTGKTLSSPLQEKRIKFFNSEINNSNNNLVSMKYTPYSGGGGGEAAGVEITIIDPKYEIVDYLCFQISSLNTAMSGSKNPATIRFEVEYGWAHNKEFVPSDIKDWDKIMFTNKFLCVPDDMDVKYNNLGFPTLTIKAEPDAINNFVYHGTNPWDLLGPHPAVVLRTEETMRLMEECYTTINKNIQKKAGISESSRQQISIINEFLTKNLQIADKGIREKIIEKSASYYDSIFKDKVGMGSTVKNFLNDRRRGSINGTVSKTNYLEGVVGYNADRKKQNVELYNLKFRTEIDKEINSPKKYFTEFFTVLGTAIYNCSKIHPFYVFTYLNNLVQYRLDNIKKAEIVNFIELWDFEVDLHNTLLPDKFFDPKYTYKKEDEKYFISVKDITAQVNSSWDSLFKSVFNCMYIKYKVTKEDKDKNTFVNVTDKEVKAGFVPIRLYSNMFVCDAKTAKKNVKSWLFALEQRRKFLKKLVDSKKSAVSNDTIKTADVAIKKTEAMLGTIASDLSEEKYLIHIISTNFDSASQFHVNVGNQKIAQAYSYRVNDVSGYAKDRFNPGEPTVWDVNFFDVINLDFEFKYRDMIQSVASASKLSGATNRGSLIIENKNKNQSNDLIAKANQIAKDKGITRGKINDATLKELESVLDELKKLNPAYKVNPLSSANNFVNPINITVGNYQQTRVYSGDLYNSLERKRSIQNLRSAMLLSKVPIKANMTVLGDPTFNFPNSGANFWVFLKVINIDNSLSFFTGLYKIMGWYQEISAGKFVTVFTLNSDFSSDGGISDEHKEQMRKIVYHSDRQNANFNS